MTRIELGSVRKYRGKSEYREVNRASGEGFEAVGDGKVIERLCVKLIDAGYQGDCEVWRGETQCFYALPISKWAQGKALTGEQPEQLRGVA